MAEVALTGRGENDRGIIATEDPADEEGDLAWNNRSGNDNGNVFEDADDSDDEIEETEEEVVDVDEIEEIEVEEREEGMMRGVDGVDHVGDSDGEGDEQSGEVAHVLLVVVLLLLLMGYPIPWRTVTTLRGMVTDIAEMGGVATWPWERSLHGNPG